MQESGLQVQSPSRGRATDAAVRRPCVPPAPLPPVIETRPDTDRVLVLLRGELDLDAGQELRHALRAALMRSTHGIDLDLRSVAFFDCSALNILLALRERALREGKTVTVRAAGPAAVRLLDLTGTRSLFSDAGTAPAHVDAGTEPGHAGAAPGPAHETATSDVGHETATPGLEDPDAESLEKLRVELVQLRRAMQTRPTIDLARGILMASFGLTADDAWTVLVATSQNTNTKLHHLARDLITAVRGAPLDDTVRQHLAAAVSRLDPAGRGGSAPEDATVVIDGRDD